MNQKWTLLVKHDGAHLQSSRSLSLGHERHLSIDRIPGGATRRGCLSRQVRHSGKEICVVTDLLLRLQRCAVQAVGKDAGLIWLISSTEKRKPF